jgi:hypothetical protein
MAKEPSPTKFELPNLKYGVDPKEPAKRMVSWRMPAPLMERLDQVARQKGYTTTELVTFVLDQYLQWNDKRRSAP